MLQHLYERDFIGYSYLTAIVDPYLFWSPYLNNLAHLCWENENIKMCCSENAPTLWVLTDREFRRDRVLTRAVPRTAITVTLQHLTLLAVVVMIMMMTMIMIIIMTMTMMINEQSMSFCHTALDIIVGGFGDYLSTFSNNIWHFDRQMMIRMGGNHFWLSNNPFSSLPSSLPWHCSGAHFQLLHFVNWTLCHFDKRCPSRCHKVTCFPDFLASLLQQNHLWSESDIKLQTMMTL